MTGTRTKCVLTDNLKLSLSLSLSGLFCQAETACPCNMAKRAMMAMVRENLVIMFTSAVCESDGRGLAASGPMSLLQPCCKLQPGCVIDYGHDLGTKRSGESAESAPTFACA